MLGIAAALAYAVPALAARALGDVGARRVLTLAWALHGLQLAWVQLTQPAHFGFAQTLSITVWLALTVYGIERRRYPRMPARWALAGFGAAVIVLALVFPGAALPATSSPLLGLHSALGLSAYGLFAAAVAHGWLMTRAPVLNRAMGLLISKEMMAPPKPMMKAKPSRAPRFRPLAVRKRLTPSRLATMPSTATTATLVNRNRTILFMVLPQECRVVRA